VSNLTFDLGDGAQQVRGRGVLVRGQMTRAVDETETEDSTDIGAAAIVVESDHFLP
jgi:hypothetical protein